MRPLLVVIALLIGIRAFAQATDTVGVSRDTTQIKVAAPVPPDTVPINNAPDVTDTSAFRAIVPATADTVIGVPIDERDTLTWRERHSPRRATILSAVIPGAGQIYNRKYWKAPIVWGGLGVCYYFINENNKQYHRYRDAYLALVDGDPATIDEFNGQFTGPQVRGVMETYQRWRDLSYIAIAGMYILNIVDASVDAHFVRFDVSPDLSLNVGPSLQTAALGGAGLSLQLVVR